MSSLSQLQTLLSPAERSYILSGLTHPTEPTRIDSRPLLSSRPWSVTYDEIPQCNGSARVSLGGTEVLAGIRLEVEDGINDDWRTRVEVDVTPQAFPHLSSSAINTLSTQLSSIIIDHLIPSIPPLIILPPPNAKYFIPYLHLTILSASASIPSVIFAAARAAFVDLRIPKTKVIGWEGEKIAGDAGEEGDAGISGMGLGMKAAVGIGSKGRTKARVRGADDWDLDLASSTNGEGSFIRLENRAELPVLITLNLVIPSFTSLTETGGSGSMVYFIDATPQEEVACGDRIHVAVNGKGKLCGIRVEGDSGIDISAIKDLLMRAKEIGEALLQSFNKEME